MEFVKSLCKSLGAQIDAFGDVLLQTLLKLCERSNKVFVTRATQALFDYIQAAPVAKTCLSKLCDALKSPNKGLKAVAAEALKKLFELSPPESLVDHHDIIEKQLVDALTDASPQVRDTSRKIYFQYKESQAESAKRIFDRLPSAVQKLLMEGARPESASSLQTKRPATHRPQHVATQPNPVSQSGSSLQNPFRIIKPSLAPPSNKEHLGSALRILKSSNTCESPHLTPGAKAARMRPSNDVGSHTPIRSHLKTCASVGEAIPLRTAPSSLATCVSAGSLFNPTSSSLRSEIVVQLTNVRNADWAIRHQAYESLCELLRKPETIAQIESSKPAVQRLIDLLVHGLTDTHLRVLEAVLQYGTAFFEVCHVSFFSDFGFLDGALAKLVYLSINPQFKGKHCQDEAGPLVGRIKSWLVDPWRFCCYLAAAYTKPEASTSVKARHWIISRIADEMNLLNFSAYGEQDLMFNLKSIILRIGSALLDHDQSLVQAAIGLFQTIKGRLNNEALFEALVLSIKFSSARAVLSGGLTKSAAPTANNVKEAAEDMAIVAEDDVEPIAVDEDYIVLDSELGIELRRRRPSTPPIEDLAKALDSVLQSPFPDERCGPALVNDKPVAQSTSSMSIEEAEVEMSELHTVRDVEPGKPVSARVEENPFVLH